MWESGKVGRHSSGLLRRNLQSNQYCVSTTKCIRSSSATGACASKKGNCTRPQNAAHFPIGSRSDLVKSMASPVSMQHIRSISDAEFCSTKALPAIATQCALFTASGQSRDALEVVDLESNNVRRTHSRKDAGVGSTCRNARTRVKEKGTEVRKRVHNRAECSFPMGVEGSHPNDIEWKHKGQVHVS